MVDEVGALADKRAVVLGAAGERHLEPFLTDLLRHAAHAARVQARRVAALGALSDALRDDALELEQKA